MEFFTLSIAWAMDPRVQAMTEAHQLRHMKLLMFQAAGSLAGLRDADLAIALRITDEELEETRELFRARGLIGDSWIPIDLWGIADVTPDLDAVDRARKLNAERQRRHREKAGLGPVQKGRNVTPSVTRNVTPSVTRNVTNNVTCNVTPNVTRNVTGVTLPPHTPLISIKTPPPSPLSGGGTGEEACNGAGSVTPSVTPGPPGDGPSAEPWRDFAPKCSPEEIAAIQAKVGELFDPLGATDVWMRAALDWTNYYPALWIEAVLAKAVDRLPTDRRIGKKWGDAILRAYEEDKGIPPKDVPAWRRPRVECVPGGVLPAHPPAANGKALTPNQIKQKRYAELAFGPGAQDEEDEDDGR